MSLRVFFKFCEIFLGLLSTTDPVDSIVNPESDCFYLTTTVGGCYLESVAGNSARAPYASSLFASWHFHLLRNQFSIVSCPLRLQTWWNGCFYSTHHACFSPSQTASPLFRSAAIVNLSLLVSWVTH